VKGPEQDDAGLGTPRQLWRRVLKSENECAVTDFVMLEVGKVIGGERQRDQRTMTLTRPDCRNERKANKHSKYMSRSPFSILHSGYVPPQYLYNSHLPTNPINPNRFSIPTPNLSKQQSVLMGESGR
jgi:hypothetical protein